MIGDLHAERSGGKQSERFAVNRRLTAEPIASAEINDGIAHPCVHGIKRDLLFVQEPQAVGRSARSKRINRLHVGVKYLHAAFGRGVISEENISRPDRRQNGIGLRYGSERDCHTFASVRPSCLIKRNGRYGFFPDGIEGDPGAVRFGKVANFGAVGINGIALLRSRPPRKRMPRFFKRIGGKQACLVIAESADDLSGRPFRFIRYGVSVGFPYRIKGNAPIDKLHGKKKKKGRLRRRLFR